MKKVATSIVLACLSFIVVGLEYLADRTHIIPNQLPYFIVVWVGATLPAVFPLVLAATIGFAIRDLFRPDTRWQAVIALALSIPIGILYYPW
jgi:hypothetical protein